MRQKNFHKTLFLTTTIFASAIFAGQANAQSVEVSNDATNNAINNVSNNVTNSAAGGADVPVVKTVVKCVAGDGHVTLTDAACPQGSDTAPAARIVVTEHYKLPATEVHHKAWTAAPAPRKPSPDVATLKAARESMLMAQSMRQQRLAGLN